MTTWIIRNLFLLPVLISGLGVILAGRATAQTLTNLHSFTGLNQDISTGSDTNSDGAGPNSLILSGNSLYGATGRGGTFGQGTVFAVHTDGTGFSTLYTF